MQILRTRNALGISGEQLSIISRCSLCRKKVYYRWIFIIDHALERDSYKVNQFFADLLAVSANWQQITGLKSDSLYTRSSGYVSKCLCSQIFLPISKFCIDFHSFYRSLWPITKKRKQNRKMNQTWNSPRRYRFFLSSSTMAWKISDKWRSKTSLSRCGLFNSHQGADVTDILVEYKHRIHRLSLAAFRVVSGNQLHKNIVIKIITLSKEQ